MSLSIWKPLLIDRIHIAVSIVSSELYSFAWGQLNGIEDLKTELVPDGTIKIFKNKYVTRLSYYPIKKRMIASIEIGTTKSKHRYFRLGLYPSKFQQGEFERFKEILSELLPEFKYQQLYETGKVSYIELAADSLTHAAHSFIPFRRRCNHSSIYVDKTGSKGSIYLGSVKSNLRFCIYDKRKQQLEKKAAVTHSKYTRIESRSRHIKLSPCELLSKMDNPFTKLQIADLHIARHTSQNNEWQSFLNDCLEDGSAQALANLPKSQRAKFMKILNTTAVPWWRPNSVWGGLSKALTAISP